MSFLCKDIFCVACEELLELGYDCQVMLTPSEEGDRIRVREKLISLQLN